MQFIKLIIWILIMLTSMAIAVGLIYLLYEIAKWFYLIIA